MYTNVRKFSIQQQLEYKKAYIGYLETFSWDYFITGSTRYELTLKSARRLVNRWYDRIRLQNQTVLFWVAEPFELKDGHHIHGLLKIPACSKLYFDLMVNYWQWATGNPDREREKWNALHLVRYDRKRRAGGYCAKYILKDYSDYDIIC